MRDAQPRPDGIEPAHAREAAGRGWPNPIGIVLLGAAMLLGMLGFAGREGEWTASANGVTLSLHAPERIRNGEFFEMRLNVEASAAVDRLVISVDHALWEDITVNTVLPAAAEEGSEDGEFTFEFGELAGGAALLMKVDAQINPDTLGGNAGSITAYDGDEPLVELPVQMEILP